MPTFNQDSQPLRKHFSCRFVYRCRPLLPGDCSSSAGQPRAAPRVRTTSVVSRRWTRTLLSAWLATVICRVVTSTPAEVGGRRPASQRASDRARSSAAARARGLPRISTSSSPPTSLAGLATAARVVLGRAEAGAAELASSRAPPSVGSARSTIGSSSDSGIVGASLASSPKFHGGNSPRPELHICVWPAETSP
jgi:hypothetical protein